MRVLLWGVYDTSKPRIRILRNGLRKAGVDLVEIHTSVWEDIQDKSQIRGLGKRTRLMIRWLFAYPGLVYKLLRAPKPDLILVSYPGILDAFMAAAAGRIRGIPVVWDVFLSLYDTIVEDRRMWSDKGLPARTLHFLENVALRCVDLAFMDTKAHARRVEDLFHLPAHSCEAVWVGVETEHFLHGAAAPVPVGPDLRVLFYGQFIPLHGIDTIIKAARLLKDEPVEWILIGKGQEDGRIRAQLAQDPLPKVRWIEWVEYEILKEWLSAADVCLGIFGTSEKAASVIPNKVFQIIASGRPLITRDSPAIRELLAPDFPCTSLVPAGNPEALAASIMRHATANVGVGEGPHCHEALQDDIDAVAIGRQFIQMIQRKLEIHD